MVERTVFIHLPRRDGGAVPAGRLTMIETRAAGAGFDNCLRPSLRGARANALPVVRSRWHGARA